MRYPFYLYSLRVWRTDGTRELRTDGRTDIPSYRDARMHLKRWLAFLSSEGIEFQNFFIRICFVFMRDGQEVCGNGGRFKVLRRFSLCRSRIATSRSAANWWQGEWWRSTKLKLRGDSFRCSYVLNALCRRCIRKRVRWKRVSWISALTTLTIAAGSIWTCDGRRAVNTDSIGQDRNFVADWMS